MRSIFLFFFGFLWLINTTIAQDNHIQNSYYRASTSLNGSWKYIVDPYENGFYNYRYEPFENQHIPSNGAFFMNAKPENASALIEYDFDKSDSIVVPGDWNTQKEKLFYYEGTVWYKKSFDYSLSKSTNRLFVNFDAANYQADIYFNGKKLGQHIGGFTPFTFEITKLLQEKDNFLIVKVDNKRKKEGVPTLNTDWWNYGGLTRGVRLLETGVNFISDYMIQLHPIDPNIIRGYIRLDGTNISQRTIEMLIPGLKIKQRLTTDENGMVVFEIPHEQIRYWSVDDPHLYEVSIKVEEDSVSDQIGFRSIDTNGHHILLNRKKIYLKGISIHEESPFSHGRGHSLEDAQQLLQWAKELGCNYVRLAHYPHNEHMVRMADQMGILVWEENPVYWTIDWDNENTFTNAINQLTEVINRDKNRASVIIWSMANETPTSDARNHFLNRLAKHTKAMDPTRLISAALEQSNYNGDPTVRTIHDPFAEVVDVLSFNQYIGWYDGLPEKCRTISWKIDHDKPVLISEFGAGAKQGFYGDKHTRWTEDFQEDLYVETLSMIDGIKQLQGFSPWILVDFRSPRRVLPGIQDGWNRKGLISEDGKKKKAFFVLKAFYKKK